MASRRTAILNVSFAIFLLAFTGGAIALGFALRDGLFDFFAVEDRRQPWPQVATTVITILCLLAGGHFAMIPWAYMVARTGGTWADLKPNVIDPVDPPDYPRWQRLTIWTVTWAFNAGAARRSARNVTP